MPAEWRHQMAPICKGGIAITQGPKIRFFAPEWRCQILPKSVHVWGGVSPQNWKSYEILEYERRRGVSLARFLQNFQRVAYGKRISINTTAYEKTGNGYVTNNLNFGAIISGTTGAGVVFRYSRLYWLAMGRHCQTDAIRRIGLAYRTTAYRPTAL